VVLVAPKAMVAQTYNYEFSVWPSEGFGFNRAVYQVFEMLGGRLAMEFTESDFERFRSELSHNGFTVREIERVPYVDPEIVD
jgi:hypothetical protein